MIITKQPIDSIYSTLISDTSAHTGAWSMITILEQATFSILTDANRDGNTITTGDTFPAGVTIYGHFTAITLAGGLVLAYKR